MTARPACARCDWQPDTDTDPGDQAAEHAMDAGHPRCIVCTRSLTEHEIQVCEADLAKTQTLLAQIVALYGELPSHLGSPAAQALDSDNRGGGEKALPGGDVLVLLAHGGTGAASHGRDDREDDPQSVAFTLGQWEDDIRHTLGEPAAEALMSVTGAAGYLERRMRQAANMHPAFDEFVADLRSLHARLETATHRRRTPVRAGADCFACTAPLYRRVIDGLEEDRLTCSTCGQQYDDAQYLLALKSAAWDAARVVRDGEAWATPASLAHDLGRSEVTIRSWQLREQVRSRRIGGIVFVNVADVEDRHEPKGKTA